MRHLNGIIWSLHHDPEAFEPVFDTAAYPDDPHEYSDGEMWAYGYMIGIELQRRNWNEFFNDPNSAVVLRPIYLLGAEDVTPEEEALTETPAQREELSHQIPASVAWIYRFWPTNHALASGRLADHINVCRHWRRDQHSRSLCIRHSRQGICFRICTRDEQTYRAECGSRYRFRMAEQEAGQNAR